MRPDALKTFADIVFLDDENLFAMWNRLKQLPGMKSRTQETVEQPSASLDVLNTVREQHPNMSVFHPESERSDSPAPPVPPMSPSKGSRRFTLKPKKRDDDSLRIRSTSPGPQIGLPKKKSAMSLVGGNNSNGRIPHSSCAFILDAYLA